MKMLKMLKIADLFTLGNFIAGLAAIFFALNRDFYISAFLILLAVLFDFLDGRIARLTGQSNELGKQMDSLADLTSFGVWPVVFGYQLGLDSIAAVSILVFFASCGMLRLARFNISRQKHFEGLPITTNGILFPALFFALSYFNIAFNNYVLAIYIIMGLLMISSIKIGKL